MLAIFGFEAAEVAFQPVGIAGYPGILQVVEHVGQGMEQEAPGPFDIGEDPSSTGPAGNGLAEALLPFPPVVDELIPLLTGANIFYLPKESPEALDRRLLGIPPAPGESLALDMHQAALDEDIRPDRPQNGFHLRQAVDRDALGHQAGLPKGQAPLMHLASTLFHSVLPIHHGPQNRIADPNHGTLSAVKVGAVDHQVSKFRQVQGGAGRTREPIAYYPLDGAAAVAALSHQLSHAVALTDPALEPDPLAIPPSRHSGSGESLTAGRAAPSLLAPGITVARSSKNPTLPAESFWLSLKLLSHIPGK